MDLDLKDRVILVAGSSRGIGKATARAFLAEGCRTIITGRNTESLMETKLEFEREFRADQVMACTGDMSQTEVIRTVLDQIRSRWGVLDGLVANIGSGRGTPGWKLTEADWQKAFDVNLWGSSRLVTEALPEMMQARHGSVVLVVSIVGLESTPAPMPYSAAKAALVNFGKNLARSVGSSNVRVNCVAPGNVLFSGGSWEKHLAERGEEVMRYIKTEVPLQRFGQPEEIANVIVFLSSDRASFITGACVVADGGQTRGI
jgi:3-oxoacyl-[acyl-carrier protein] reductase